MELEPLLRRASATPLGPLVFTYEPAGTEAWNLTVTLGDRTRVIRAEQDASTEGVILACKVDAETSTTFVGPWVSATKLDDLSGQMERRLWLHGDGLSSALLLNALAALVPIAVAEAGAPEGIVLERIIIPTIPEEPKPEPVPVERPKPVGWNSFGFGQREAAEPEPSPAPVVAVETPEPTATDDVAGHSEPEVEAAAEVTSDTTEPKPTPLPEPEPEVEVTASAGKSGYCRECGSPFRPDHAFCTNCGAKLQ